MLQVQVFVVGKRPSQRKVTRSRQLPCTWKPRLARLALSLLRPSCEETIILIILRFLHTALGQIDLGNRCISFCFDYWNPDLDRLLSARTCLSERLAHFRPRYTGAPHPISYAFSASIFGSASHLDITASTNFSRLSESNQILGFNV
jgi:hypothetical protein